MAGMLKNPSLWMTVGGISTASSLYLVRGITMDSIIGWSRPGGVWRLLAIIFALLNLKTLPFGWHVRLFHGLLSHVSLLRNRPPKTPGPARLFHPVITSSRTVFMDLDYNLHKSNSTYFADLDIARMHCMARVFALGMHRARFGAGESKKEQGAPAKSGGQVGVHLGGVTCNFRKELKPYEPFEIWTRVLCWDQKWVYLVSHIVEAGAVEPGKYTMQPWKQVNQSASRSKAAGAKIDKGYGNGSATAQAEGSIKGSDTHPAIIATSLAKYVFKRNRWTIPPEIALANSGLLPPRPSSDLAISDAEAEEMTDVNGEFWDWDRVERERARGMELAQHLAGLDALLGEFPGDGAPVLGRW